MLPDLPLKTIASGATGNVPTMIGTTLDEMTLFIGSELGVGELDGAAVNRQMQQFFGDRTEEIVGRYRRTARAARPRDVLTAISTDRVFRIPAIRLAEAQVAQGRPTYMYLFTWATPGHGRQAQELPRARAAVHVGRDRSARPLACSPATVRSARPSPT